MLDLSAGSWLLPPVRAIHLRHSLVLPVAATLLFLGSWAFADTNDPAAIEQRLKALEATPERQALVREPVSQARKALKRVLDARAAGDATHAIQLAQLANDWATLAANVVKAVELEKEVAVLQTKLTELDQRRRRTETLLEATIAQRERTRQELARGGHPGPTSEPAPTAEQKAQGKAAQPKRASTPTSTGSPQDSANGQPQSVSGTSPSPIPPSPPKSPSPAKPGADQKGKP